MNQRKSQELKYVMTIPSVDFLNYVAIKDLMLLGSNDKRYQDLKKQNPVLKQYLDSFRTCFGKKVNPSIIVRDKSMPKVHVSHLCAFRNAIAIAAVIGSRTLSYINNEATGHYCTDLFDFHPVSISSDGTDLIAKTDVTWRDVHKMIKVVPWRDRKLRVKNLKAVGDKKGGKTTLPVHTYGRLRQTRNAYIHGVPMRKGEYEFRKRKSWGNLFFQAPALYRCVLANALNSRGFGELLAYSQKHDLYEKVLLYKNNRWDPG